MAKKQKYYVVWRGRSPGVYLSWDDCQAQIFGFQGAKYKSFARLSDAEAAFLEQPTEHIKVGAPKSKLKGATPERTLDELRKMGVDMSAICVDAACSGNPGVLEYQGVTMDGKLLFHRGPFPEGTVNLGEFLALVSALAMLHAKGDHQRRIYTDSMTALAWLRKKAVKTKLLRNEINGELLDRVEKARQWLLDHSYTNPISKWETEKWGEIPADFGRK